MEDRKRITEYLTRISIAKYDLGPTVEGLRLLQTKHLLSVPFENLDIHWNRPIVLTIDRFYEKIVENGRGGFCYELNGLFNDLLKDLDFQTRLISARVFNGAVYGPEFDHAAIIVTIGNKEYLADVGFGDFTAEPLRVVLDEEQSDAAGKFVVRRFDDEYVEVAKHDGENWISQYIFKDIARDLSEFAEMCDFQQYSPDSHFTKGKLCSLMTTNGRKTLTDRAFISSEQGNRSEAATGSGKDFEDILRREFAIDRKSPTGLSRKPSRHELKLLESLICKAEDLDLPPKWSDSLLVQTMDDGGMGSFRLLALNVSETGRLFGKAVSGCEFVDDDGVTVIVSLNTDKLGELFEVDVWKTDYSPLKGTFPEVGGC